MELDGKYIIEDNYFAENNKDDYEAVICEILDKELAGNYKIDRIDMSGNNCFIDYSTKDTKIDELYDLGMKFGQRDGNNITLFWPYVEIYIPDGLNLEQDMRARITNIMEEFAKRKIIISFNFHTIKDEAFYSKGTETVMYLRDDLTGFYLSDINDNLTISVENYVK